MKIWLLTLAMLAGWGLMHRGFAADHPRLLFSKKDLPALREKITQEPFKSMVQRLIADVDRGDWGGSQSYDEQQPYHHSVQAQRCAFLYVLTGEDKWALQARKQVEKRISDTTKQGWANARLKGLALYWHGSKIAMAYDWCHGAPSWDAAFCAQVSQKLKAQGETIILKGGADQNTNAASNWQGSRFAAGGLCLLASDETIAPGMLDQCFKKVVTYMNANLGESASSRGWNCEGLGYTYFPMGNYVGPFAIAYHRASPEPKNELRNAAAATRWSLWTVYAALSKAMGGIRPDFGDDNPGTAGEGTYGLAFYFCDPALRPGLKYWYDRVWGLQGDRSFDCARGGTVFSILYYPADIEAIDPLEIPQWREGFTDLGGNGFMTFRNRYRDQDDMVAQVYLKLRGNRGHSGPDALSFRILGLDTAWAVGGGRYGPKINGQDAYLRSQNTVYPCDPEEKLTINGNSAKIIGTPSVQADGSGYVIADIAANNVGAVEHKRYFVANYRSQVTGAEATFVVHDSSRDGTWWQLATLPVHAIKTEGNTFTLTAENGHYLHGTILYPSENLRFKTGKRIRGSGFVGGHNENGFLSFRSDDAHFLVVLNVCRKGTTPPKVSAEGNWASAQPKGTVKVGNWQSEFSGDEVK